MTERRFLCTACGKCCTGQLPLTLRDALTNAHRFPLAMLWTTVRHGAKSFDVNARLGTVVELGKKKQIAIQVTPISYLPPTAACPALADDGTCSIHTDKPLRCRTMPFYPYRDEEDQADLLVPRNGWLCDTSTAAPVVYRDRKIVDRVDFDRERRELADQAPLIRNYADEVMSNAPNVAAAVQKAAKKRGGGYIVLGITAVLAKLPDFGMADFIRLQRPVLDAFAARTEKVRDAEEFHRYYRDNAAAMGRYLDRLASK